VRDGPGPDRVGDRLPDLCSLSDEPAFGPDPPAVLRGGLALGLPGGDGRAPDPAGPAGGAGVLRVGVPDPAPGLGDARAPAALAGRADGGGVGLAVRGRLGAGRLRRLAVGG